MSTKTKYYPYNNMHKYKKVVDVLGDCYHSEKSIIEDEFKIIQNLPVYTSQELNLLNESLHKSWREWYNYDLYDVNFKKQLFQGRHTLIQTILSMPLDDMPLYINTSDTVQSLATWRLRIGK